MKQVADRATFQTKVTRAISHGLIRDDRATHFQEAAAIATNRPRPGMPCYSYDVNVYSRVGRVSDALGSQVGAPGV